MNQLEQTRGQPPRVDFQIGMRGYTPFYWKEKKRTRNEITLLPSNSALVSLSLFILPFNYYTVELPVLISRSTKWQDIHARTPWRFDGQSVTCRMANLWSFLFSNLKKNTTINDVYLIKYKVFTDLRSKKRRTISMSYYDSRRVREHSFFLERQQHCIPVIA